MLKNTYNEGCVFCRIIKDQTEAEHVVFEDDRIIAFLDAYPIARGHTLIVLKEHHPDLASIAPDDAAELGKTVALIAKAIKEVCRVPFVYVASINEQVKHVHYHLVPRGDSDKKGFGHFLSRRSKRTDGAALAARLKTEISHLL